MKCMFIIEKNLGQHFRQRSLTFLVMKHTLQTYKGKVLQNQCFWVKSEPTFLLNFLICVLWLSYWIQSELESIPTLRQKFRASWNMLSKIFFRKLAPEVSKKASFCFSKACCLYNGNFTAIREGRAVRFQVLNSNCIAPKIELEWLWIYSGSPAEKEVHVYYRKKSWATL